MKRPYDYNEFNKQKHLLDYLEYLTDYLKKIEVKLSYNKFYKEKKLHIDINIYEQDISIFNHVINVNNIDDYKSFACNLYSDLDYFIISKELTFERLAIFTEQPYLDLKRRYIKLPNYFNGNTGNTFNKPPYLK